jgi:alpha-galactosidase
MNIATQRCHQVSTSLGMVRTTINAINGSIRTVIGHGAVLGSRPMVHHPFGRLAVAVVAAIIAATSASTTLDGRDTTAQTEALRATEAPANALWLDSLDLSKMVQRRGAPRARAYAGGNARDAAKPLTLAGVVYPHGIGTLSINELIVDLKGQATRFVAMAGIDDAVRDGQGSITVEAWVDNKQAFISNVIKAGDPPQLVDINLEGARFLELLIDDGNDVSTGDYADWAGALLYLKPGATSTPESWTFPSEPAPPIASGWPAAPRINPPRITGGTPGRPFLFRIPATGDAPLSFSARGLPAGVALDPRTGIISGAIVREGRTDVEITVTNAAGKASQTLTIVGGADALALTPPLGWNSWNVWGDSVDDAKVRSAADAMVTSGLAAHGYQFVSIDDGWEGQRDANGVLQPNAKFPDMKGLADYVHGKGLKIGIYSSPGPRTCQGLPGSLGYEEIDARTWASWGFDLLKHDWCSYGNTRNGQPLAELQKPYITMRAALDKTGRDIVYSLCQYGLGRVWEWGATVGGNFWRTTGDLTDVWSNMAAVGFRQAGREQWSKPGHWTDPDMLVVGKVGWGPNVHDTRLTPNEQITHITLWTIQAAPLLLGADMARFDKFTTDLMTNHEVLDVNQDVLGRGGSRVWQQDRLEVWVKPLADGTRAVALFNRGLQGATVAARWSDLGIAGAQPVRDLWQQRALGTFTNAFSTVVPAHGAMLVKIGTPR